MNAGEFQRTDTVAVELPPTREIVYFAQVANFHLNANYFFFNLDHFLKKIDKTANVSDWVYFFLQKRLCCWWSHWESFSWGLGTRLRHHQAHGNSPWLHIYSRPTLL
jgi:hypothetical protein